MDVLSWIAFIGTFGGVGFLIWIAVKGDPERDDEEAARAFFDEHGRWPDEPEPSAG